MILLGAFLAAACAPRKTGMHTTSTATGGVSSNGGSSTASFVSGGATQEPPSTGGTVAGGGTVSNGGTVATTGYSAPGGAGSSGSSGSAGSSVSASSSVNNGGASGGAFASGGSRATGGASASGGVFVSGGSRGTGGASASGGAGGTSSPAGGTPSTVSSTTPAGPCTTDSQCPNGHCVSGSCVCWDTNQKVCAGTCTDIKYNNNSCGDCNNRCPATAPRCDNGTCKCDSPPCGGTSTGGTSGSGGSASTGGTPATGGSRATGGVTSTGGSTVQGGSTTNGGTTSGGSQPAPITNGTDGWASRYWDCCKPSCGWKENANGNPMQSCSQDNSRLSAYDTQSACGGGSAFMCWDFAPWSASDTLSYGFAAYNGVACGTCFQLQFTGTSQGGDGKSTPPLSGKTMIVQVINVGGIAANQFDLLIPGGGVGDFNACSNQWGSSDLGATYGGFLTGCSGDKTCVQNKCSTILSSKPLLKAGCDWFTGWFNAADNPALKYQKVTCPSQITSKSGMSG